MKLFRTFILTVLVGLLSQSVWAQDSKPLTDLKPATEELVKQDSPFSLGGRVMHYGLASSMGGDSVSVSVYDLSGKYSRFTAWVGVPDGQSSNYGLRYVVRLDGKAVVDNKDDLMTPDKAPVHIDIDVTGVQSIKLEATNALSFGEPTLYKSAPPSSSVTTLVAPTDGIQVTGNSVNLSWEPVNEATNYGVEIVCTKGSTPYIYSVNVLGGVSNTKFDLTKVPNGSYQWSVIAFNGNGVMGKFSKSRTFVVFR